MNSAKPIQSNYQNGKSQTGTYKYQRLIFFFFYLISLALEDTYFGTDNSIARTVTILKFILVFLKVSPCYTFIFQRPRGITESCVDMSGYLSPAFNKLGRKSAVSSQQKTEEKKTKTKRKRASDGRELPSRAILISDTIRIDQTLKD